MHRHDMLRVNRFDKFHYVIRKDVAAGVALNEFAVNFRKFGFQHVIFRLLQIARPIGINALGAMWKVAIEIHVHH